MSDTTTCTGKESSLNELLREPIITMMMTSDGVHSDDIRALFRDVAAKNVAAASRERPRARQLFECDLTR